ncbi:14021_t:CDS:1 [Gigaspora margarita]|uniref:14021_t:CDS:1 n=1 Tax=Gigaspora margarita TaxID=4874 RepID=A0ABN7VHK0_GIGMA|nr:14021_t:CDS:1 [Gigaspora margarita]
MLLYSNNNKTHETEHEQIQKAIAQQLRQTYEQETCKLEPSSESIVQFNKNKHKRVECKRDKHKRSEYKQNECERNNYKSSKHEKNASRIPENATNIPSKRSIAQCARRKQE